MGGFGRGLRPSYSIRQSRFQSRIKINLALRKKWGQAYRMVIHTPHARFVAATAAKTAMTIKGMKKGIKG